jgi:hypothetical protein
MPLILALGRQRQADSEFEDSQDYTEKPCLEKPKKKKKKKKKLFHVYLGESMCNPCMQEPSEARGRHQLP